MYGTNAGKTRKLAVFMKCPTHCFIRNLNLNTHIWRELTCDVHNPYDLKVQLPEACSDHESILAYNIGSRCFLFAAMIE